MSSTSPDQLPPARHLKAGVLGVNTRTRVVFCLGVAVLAWIAGGMPLLGKSFTELRPPAWVAIAVNVVVSVLVLAVGGLIGRHTKAVLVYWRRKDPMPGSRAFEEGFLDSDPRLDRKQLLKRVGGKFPSAPSEQNALWYSLYQKHQRDPIVAEKHFRFLEFRDLSWFAIVLAMLALVNTIVAWFSGGHALELTGLTGAFAALYFLVRKAAKTYGLQFVSQVLVRESQTSGPARSRAKKDAST